MLDTSATADWLIEALKRYCDHPIEAIIPVAHGAAVAGIRNGSPAFIPPDYEHEIPADVLQDYRAGRDSFAVTGSPALPGGLNMGSQLHELEARSPGQFREITLMPYAQYWAWLLCGTAVSEVSSLGCHTDLWSPGVRDFSPMARHRGWAEQFATLAFAGDVIGTLRPQLAARTGLSQAVHIHAGLHDSNAALHAARAFPEIAAHDATVLSTGTWFIAMRRPGPSPGKGLDLAALRETRDCLVNVDVFGQPVPSARFMGGRELERLGGRIDQPGLRGLDDVLASGHMILPGIVPGSGPFPDAVRAAPGEPQDEFARTAAMALYTALMADASLDLIDSAGRLLIEGRFASSELFTRALASLRPDTQVYVADAALDASFGALQLVDPAIKPAGKLIRVEPLRCDLQSYRHAWRETATHART